MEVHMIRYAFKGLAMLVWPHPTQYVNAQMNLPPYQACYIPISFAGRYAVLPLRLPSLSYVEARKLKAKGWHRRRHTDGVRLGLQY